jgi:hypothetical protein
MRKIAILIYFLLLNFICSAQYIITFKNGSKTNVESIKGKNNYLYLNGLDEQSTKWSRSFIDSNVVSITDNYFNPVYFKNFNGTEPLNIGGPQYEFENFLGKSVFLKNVEVSDKFTILTFEYRRPGWLESSFIISSTSILYNKFNVTETYRILNAGDYNLDTEIPTPIEGEVKTIKAYFERIKDDVSTLNYKSPRTRTGSISGHAYNYQTYDLILGIKLKRQL